MNTQPSAAALRVLKGLDNLNLIWCPPEEIQEAARVIDAELAQERERARELERALSDLLRVDEEWHGSVNSEMSKARNAARAILAKIRAEREGGQ